MNHKQAVITAMKMFSDSYPGKFTVGTNVGTWEQVLSDIDPGVIPAAALHLISTRKDWPPDPATLREQCILMSHGQLQEPTGSEAWERIREKFHTDDLELTDMEKQALKQTSSIYDLKRSTNPSTDRAHFIKAFDLLVAKRKLDRQTLPEVKALVEKHRPALPEHEDAPQLPPVEPEYPDENEVRQLVAQLAESRGV